MEVGTYAQGGRSLGERSPSARRADPVFEVVLTVLAALILVLVGTFFVVLIVQAEPTLSHSGVFSFAFGNNWDFGNHIYQALPLLVGTLVISGISLLIGVPVAIATALYITELAPRRLRTPFTILVDLVAAVPSVVFGLWGIAFLIPHLQGFEKGLASLLSAIPIIGGGMVAGPNYFIAGLILAVMILPIVSAISREVMSTVPTDHKEAALALGATRWEMIRMAVIPYAKAGIAGGAMLGLGRAIGEAIAVSYVIGGNATLIHHVFGQGDALAPVIARQFNEADSGQRGALIAAGLLLFILTLLINFAARGFVNRGRRGRRDAGAGAAGVMAA